MERTGTWPTRHAAKLYRGVCLLIGTLVPATPYVGMFLVLVGRRARSVAEGSLQQLEMAYNKLEDSEREKRAAGILKVLRTKGMSFQVSDFVPL